MYTTTRLVSAMGARVYGVPGNFETEAVVLRSIRYGEADRILHLYTERRGRVGAMAKGVRRVKTRFGGRLEPLFRVNLILHEGRGDLCTVTSAETDAAHPRLRALQPEAHRFLVEALARPLAEAPQAPEGALRQADRAIAETLEHHAHVRLRRVA